MKSGSLPQLNFGPKKQLPTSTFKSNALRIVQKPDQFDTIVYGESSYRSNPKIRITRQAKSIFPHEASASTRCLPPTYVYEDRPAFNNKVEYNP
jgi:hypothetical protein